MISDFHKYQAQTTPHPLGLQVDFARGSYIYDTTGNAHLDFVAGVSASILGHCHPAVVEAIQKQTERYLHVMVYGEYAQAPAVKFSKMLAELLPIPQASTYMVNSGTEAIEGAMKLARRFTGKKQILAAKNAYHGNTMGSMSLMSLKERSRVFEPLIPEIDFIKFNDFESIEKITEQTAGVVLETIQGGAGFIEPKPGFLNQVKMKCEKTGSLLILDEIQTGFGRTGKLFGFENFNVIPDILVVGKGMAGGLPCGAFIANRKIMKSLSHEPMMGHITTFGGNAVVAAAALATLKEVRQPQLQQGCLKKEHLIREKLKHPLIKEVRGRGLMLALIMDSAETANELVLKAKSKGLILFWLLFEKKAVRITPPLNISEKEIYKACTIIHGCLDEINSA